jgi:hypothetical protein
MAFIPGPVVGIRFLLLGAGWIGISRSPYTILSIINREKKEHPSESFFKAFKASADPGDPVGEAFRPAPAGFMKGKFFQEVKMR